MGNLCFPHSACKYIKIGLRIKMDFKVADNNGKFVRKEYHEKNLEYDIFCKIQ